MTGLGLDLRAGLRGLWRNRGVAATAIVSLALGIGANSAIFSVVHAVLLRPLPYADPGRLVRVVASSRERGLADADFSYARFTALLEHARTLAAVGAYAADRAVLGGEEPVELGSARVSSGVLEALGVQPALGRNF